MNEVIGPLLGAVVGATAVLVSQYLSGKREEKLLGKRIDADKALKQMDFDRLNLGVHNQVCALVAEVGKFVYYCTTTGPIDWPKMNTPLTRILDRIYEPDIASALSPSQAAALYDAAGQVEVAYTFALQQSWGRPKWDKVNAAEANSQCRGTFNGSCKAIGFFWHEMGDEAKAQHFKAAADAAWKAQ